MRLTVIHAVRRNSVVFPARVYAFGRRAMTADRFAALNVPAWLRGQQT